MTPVAVTTDPPGATIYSRGAGRASYQWEYKGTTKDGNVVEFKVPYNAINTVAVWPAANGKPAYKSEVVYSKLLFKDNAIITIKRK